MDSHNDLLGELAADAALERSDFIVQATEQLRRFLDHHKDRIAVLGGLTLIDDEPDYLSIAPDLSFRSRSRYLDDITGEWVSETEVIESASELDRALQPGRRLRGVRRGRPRGRRDARRADRRGRPARGLRDLARGRRLAVRGSVRRGRRFVGGRPADLAVRGRRRVGRAPAVRPVARIPGTQPAQRGAPARRVRGRVGRPGLGHRRPDHRGRRRRATVADDQRLPGRGHPRGLRGRVADAQRLRPAGRVLRPDRRVRRPGRRAGRGVPGGRAGAPDASANGDRGGR